MSVDEKLEYFEMLVRIGFKQIEVGFPSASDTEFNFLRRLVAENRIPEDVTVQVLVQARDHLIRRTFESLWGRELLATAVSWLVDEPAAAFRAAVRIRSRHEAAPATVEPAGVGAWRVRFDEPQRAITPGQVAAFYDGDTVLGAGTIACPAAVPVSPHSRVGPRPGGACSLGQLCQCTCRGGGAVPCGR